MNGQFFDTMIVAQCDQRPVTLIAEFEEHYIGIAEVFSGFHFIPAYVVCITAMINRVFLL